MYEYKCYTVRVIDGNTIEAQIDLGFNVLVRQRIKLYGINTPDLKSEDKDLAIAAKNKLAELVGKEFVCETIMNKRGKAGRILGRVFQTDINGNRIDVNQTLKDEGYASDYRDHM